MERISGLRYAQEPHLLFGLYEAYLDQEGSLLGETCIRRTTAYCPWSNTPTFHLIPASDNVWQDYSFELSAELGHLPGVEAGKVRQIEVVLTAAATNC